MGNNKQQRIDVRDYTGGEYLAVADITKPMVVTITDAFVAEFDDGSSKVALRFEELPKALTLNTENTTRLKEMFGSPYANEWHGQITLYIDKGVTNRQGQRVGGIRVADAESMRRQRTNGSARHLEEPRYDGDPEYIGGEY